MVEETLSGAVPNSIGHSQKNNRPQTAVNQQAAAAKAADTRARPKPVGRQQRLIIHLLIGLSMAGIAFFGYAFFGARPTAKAADMASHRLVDVTTLRSNAIVQTKGSTAAPEIAAPSSDLTALHAEMEEINRRMRAIQAAGVPQNIPSPAGTNSPAGMAGNGNSIPSGGMAGNNLDSTLASLDEMMATVHGMLAKVDQANSQSGGSSSPAGGTGHH